MWLRLWKGYNQVYEGPDTARQPAGRAVDNVVRTPREQIGEWLSLVRKSCLPVGILLGLVILVAVIGSLVSAPIFRAADYRDLLNVQTGSFTEDMAQISFGDILTRARYWWMPSPAKAGTASRSPRRAHYAG